MSGNKYILLLIAAIIVQACAGTKKGAKGPREEVIITTREDTVRIGIAPEDTLIVPRYELKERYNVALLLPFHLDSFDLYASGEVDDIIMEDDMAETEENESAIPRDSRMALSFYEGAQIALKQLSDSGLNMNLYVYDTKNSPGEVRRLFFKPEMRNMDLIIGPIFNQTVETALEQAEARSTYLVSPLSPTVVTEDGNPYYILLNPTLETHIEAIHNHILTHYRHANHVILHRQHLFEEQQATAFMELAKQDSLRNNYYRPAVFNIDETEFDLDGVMVNDKVNVIIIPSYDEAFINNAGRQLNARLDSQNIIVFGMPNWFKFETLALDYMDKLELHLPASYYLNDSSEAYLQMKHLFIDSFHTVPDDIALKGYDVAMYFGYLLHRYGLSFEEMFSSEPYNGLISNFHIEPVYKGGMPLPQEEKLKPQPAYDRLENDHSYILKYENFRLIKVN